MLREYYPRYFSELKDEPVDILASDTERTLQTAKVIAEILDTNISISHALTTRNFDEIMDLISQANKTTILVGHNPVMEEVASKLTQRLRGMLRGEALCLEKKNHKYEILWKCSPR